MTAEHDNGAPYLLGALDDSEREAFEVHLEECADCREEVERLRPAA
jgi:anti-sigma factor RsiW